ISVSMASMRDTAKTLAIRPDTVAMIAMPTVQHTAQYPNAGLAASASEKSLAARISVNGRVLDSAHATNRYTKRLKERDATIDRPIFLWGLTISEPLLVIVVNPLNDRMVSATAAIMLVIVASSVLPLPSAGVMEKPATHNPPIAKTTSPIILSRDTIEVN